MIKSNELMIGDWVAVARKDREDYYCETVRAIFADNIIVGDYVATEHKLFSIPITENILDQIGVRCEQDRYWSLESGMVIELFKGRAIGYTGDESFWREDECFNAASLHELQHALRLQGLSTLADKVKPVKKQNTICTTLEIG